MRFQKKVTLDFMVTNTPIRSCTAQISLCLASSIKNQRNIKKATRILRVAGNRKKQESLQVFPPG